MYTIVGLGNPGEEYTTTRHNAGRIVAEAIVKKYNNDFTPWKHDTTRNALVSRGLLFDTKVEFVLPETFMNNSGKSVRQTIQIKKDLARLIVIYDDMDLPLGKIKISYDRSAGGHNGLASIIRTIKSQEFVRIRIGIAPTTPSGKTKTPHGEKAVHDFLLKNFKEKELLQLKKIAKIIEASLEILLTETKEKAMSVYNQ